MSDNPEDMATTFNVFALATWAAAKSANEEGKVDAYSHLVDGGPMGLETPQSGVAMVLVLYSTDLEAFKLVLANATLREIVHDTIEAGGVRVKDVGPGTEAINL